MANEDKIISDFDELNSLEDSDLFLVESSTTHNARASTLKAYILTALSDELQKLDDIDTEAISNAIDICESIEEPAAANDIANSDSFYVKIGNELKAISFDKIVEKINGGFDIEVVSDTDSEYILKFTIGSNNIVTPNLKPPPVSNVDLNDVKKYGFCIDRNSSNPKITRIGDARYLVAEPNTGNENNRNDFDNIYPFSNMRRCTLTVNGTITSYQGEPGYTENGSIGEVMNEIPKYYRQVYISEATGKEYRWYSKEKLNEYYQVPKRFLDKNGNELDYTYIAAFLMSTNDGNTEGYSRSGNYYHTKLKYSVMQRLGKEKGPNWHMMDIWDYDVIKDLWLLEWATLDSQSIYYGASALSSTRFEAYADSTAYFAEYDEEEYTVYGSSFLAAHNVFKVGDEITLDCIENEEPEALDNETEIVRTILSVTPSEEEDCEDLSVYVFSGSDVLLGSDFYVKLNINRCGVTNGIKSSSGQLEGTEGKQQFVWRGIENLYGLEYTWLDGIILNDNKYYVQHDPALYDIHITIDVEDPEDPENEIEVLSYTPLRYNHPTSGYISKMEYDEETGLTMPTETVGTSNSYYCDYFTRPRTTTSDYSCRFGGYSGLQGGLFNLFCNYNTTLTLQYAARLSYSHYE